MTTILGVHSFRRGAGKSLLAGSLAVVMARAGLDVTVIDANRGSTDVAVRLGTTLAGPGFEEALTGAASITDVVHDATSVLGGGALGRLSVVPGGSRSEAHRDVVGYREREISVLREIVMTTRPDLVVVDTPSGLTEDTMTILTIVDDLILIAQAEHADHQGTAVTIDVARRLGVPRVGVALVELPVAVVSEGDLAPAEAQFDAPVIGTLPVRPDGADRPDGAPFVVQHAADPWSLQVLRLASRLLEEREKPRPAGRILGPG
jgi:MinD-like ATPase involved in chromosome partitioning or flagellar assembly